ncbi:hypothetical protein PPERSA_12256 [Pseudocohnilembus persalinus]|uniref:Uncharacterized protein n=1 Tax=Pseudocohnilembus persalinus TaxID=266149 RepID=A0A0V0R4X4_PSEPJ|nr:hypothetical protein PPERSA_12256 [Pseudocohnilembus persalinus]|eukprot:KRX09513.1 hypothetical protein PPERSA_12256 [Pseudocohnilembus persalinus]
MEELKVIYESMDEQNYNKNLNEAKTYGNEAEGYSIDILPTKLNVLKVTHQIDGNNGYNMTPKNLQLDVHQFFQIHLFFRPGHYDFCYIKESEETQNDPITANNEQVIRNHKDLQKQNQETQSLIYEMNIHLQQKIFEITKIDSSGFQFPEAELYSIKYMNQQLENLYTNYESKINDYKNLLKKK